MRDIVEEVLSGDGEGRPPGEVEDVRVAVVGVGAAGAGRLTGIGRRLRDEAFVGQLPADIDAVGVDLPGEETRVRGWEPAAWHVVESLERPDRGGRPRLGPEGTDCLRRFVADRLDRYDVLVQAVDGTDPAAVAVAGDLAAAFRGGIAQPVVSVPTVDAEDPPAGLLGAASGWLPETRDRFGPDAVVPVEHGRATELAASEGRAGAPTAGTGDPVERVAEDVTAALAEALGTRVQFGSLAGDLHHLRGRVVAHVGREEGGAGRTIDADALAADALATPVSGEPPGWRAGGPWLAHLRSASVDDDGIDTATDAAGAALDEAAGVDGDDRPARLRSYRHTATDGHALFLFRVEAPDEPDDEPFPHVDLDDVDLDDDAFAVDDDDFDPESGFDVVR